MNNLQKFAERLSELLIDHEIKPANLADALGVNRKVISRYVNAERLPDIDMAISMAKYFDCTIDFLLGRSDKDSKFQPLSRPKFDQRLQFLLQFFKTTKYRIHIDTGIDQSVIYDWQKGTVSPSMESVIRLADYFECSVDFVIGLSDKL